MKCPFRKNTTRRQYQKQYCSPVYIAEEDFGDCYKADCPYYIADEQDVTKFRCARCNNAEHLIANGVVHVVRCKDCKYSEDMFMSGIYCNHPDNRNPLGCRPDDFCNDGERKEGETE